MKLPEGEIVGDWVPITQERIRQFAEATEDRQWIHVDEERAAGSPYGGTIAHGFLTLSLIGYLLRESVRIDGVRMGLNYGLNRVRFPAAVRAGSRVRGRFRVASVERGGELTKVTWNVTVECDSAPKPCCIAEWVVAYVEEKQEPAMDTRPVRASEQLDWEKLGAYLRSELGVEGPMDVSQFPGGHSNLTYDLRFGDRELVLRRPPFGPVPPKAHDMAREYRVLAAVHPHFPLAPRPWLLCEDASVIGSVFYVMERRRGIVVRNEEPVGFTADVRSAISASMIDTLVNLHAIDVHETGLEALGKPAGFVARQIRGWTERWHGSKTSDVPDMEALARWLDERIPPDPARPALVHGDYKLDNVMLDPGDPARLTGVFDWEMSAIGDPLVDLGIVLCYWVHAVGDDSAIPGVTRRPGWFTREQILSRYAERSGRSVDAIAVYEVFAVFKLAVVIQQIYARFVRGQTDDPRFAALGDRVSDLARIAVRLAE